MDSLINAAEQDAIADSLVAPLDSEGQAGEQYQEQESGAEQGGQEQQDDWQQITDELRGETERIEAESNQEVEQEQPSEVSPQAVQEAVAELDSYVTERGLVDPAESTLLATSLGVDPANSAALGSVVSKVAVSALSVLQQTGGDFSKIGEMPRENARAFTAEFLRACGVDPRTSNADPQQLASVVMNGTLSFLQAVSAYGLNASLDQLNSAEASEWFASALFQCFGQTQQVDRAYALNLADSAGRYLLSVLRKLDSQQAAQPQQRRSSSRSGRGQQRSSTGRSRYKTNQDIFDSEAEEMWRVQHGRL